MNNEAIKSSSDFTPYQLSVAELEKETGFTFFPALSQEIKEEIHTSIW